MARSARSHKPSRVPSDDGRSADARLMRRTREALVKHLGGNPTATQAGIVDEIAWLTLYLTRMNEAALKKGGLPSLHMTRQYLAYSNSRSRALARLGLKAVPAPPPSIAELMARPTSRAAA